MVGGVSVAGVRYALSCRLRLCCVGDGDMQPEGMGHSIAQLVSFAVGLVVLVVVALVMEVFDMVVKVVGGEHNESVGVLDWGGVEVGRFGVDGVGELATGVWGGVFAGLL